jgi:hypothetical protein
LLEYLRLKYTEDNSKSQEFMIAQIFYDQVLKNLHSNKPSSLSNCTLEYVLEELDMKKRMGNVEPGVLSKFGSLKKINKSTNDLIIDEKWFAKQLNLATLEVLDVSENRIFLTRSDDSHFDNGIGLFEGLVSLKQLNISKCEIGDELKQCKNTFAGLANLEQLNMSNNKIALVHVDTLAGLSSLVKLNLNGNILELESATFAGLRNLHTLFIGLGSMRNVNAFESLVSLKTLMLNTINCTHMDSGIFGYLHGLEKLKWQVNLLPEEWSVDLRDKMKHLKSINISKPSQNINTSS